jgi:membrane protease YdiL (CAAX protease family)
MTESRKGVVNSPPATASSRSVFRDLKHFPNHYTIRTVPNDTMKTDTRSSVSNLAEIRPLTIGTVAIALLALPLFAVLEETAILDIGRVGELAIEWGIAAVVVGTAVGIEDRSFTDIGFRRPAWIDIGYLIVTAVAALLVFAGTDPLVSALGLPVSEDSGTMATGVGLTLALAGAVTTGVVEEILFRGYPIERLLDYSDNVALAGGITWAVFTAAHTVVWPVGNLVQIAAVAAVFTVVYLRRRTLYPVIGAHVLVWVFAVLGQFYG